MENFGETLMAIIEHELKSTSTSPNGIRYSDDVKSFATTLRFYSPKAYEHLRTVFTLPDESTIRRWATSLGCRPGFNRDMLNYLKEKLEADSTMKDVTLMFDAMAIRSEYAYDAKNKCYSGSVDMGSAKVGISEDTLATEALVFMVVGLRGHWKQPIGHFFINKVSAEVQANIVQEAIVLMHDYGFCVRAVVCDGSHTNQATARNLGCRFVEDELIHTFPHPSNGEEVCFLLDACHLLKNVRNTLGDKQVIVSDGKLVKWNYIQELHNLQIKDNLVLANKLKSNHIRFRKNKMKVKFAAQTISHSVATAIDFCRAHLQLPQFEDSEETSRFIKVFNQAFDICNSSNPLASGYKSRIDRHNLQMKCNAIDNICTYIRQLEEPSGRLLICGPRKTAFIGFIITLSSIKKLATYLLSSDESGFKYVLTYKLSQDHLETFFSMIRGRGGWNNNPNTMQFQYALRALLQKNGITPSKN